MNGVEDEVGTMGGETRIYLLPSGALRSLDSQCNYLCVRKVYRSYSNVHNNYRLYGYLLKFDVFLALCYMIPFVVE